MLVKKNNEVKTPYNMFLDILVISYIFAVLELLLKFPFLSVQLDKQLSI